ncbi:hypothetical protein [Rhizobium sp. BK602]|uniref:hypothetical protein n=1 Tax=Rhizobium sp. BK602 TaxID=2586986 RepID=UPI0018353799|nr:hypothetical protein [Rhizobium sp. BK602]
MADKRGTAMAGNEQNRKSSNGVASANEQEAVVNSETTIDQVRDLLFGGAQRSIEGSLTSLREEMQAVIKQLQAEFAKELAAVQDKLQQLERTTEEKRLASHRDVGVAISELGATISKLGSGGTGR